MSYAIKASCLALISCIWSLSLYAAPVLYFSDANQYGVTQEASQLAIEAQIDGSTGLDSGLWAAFELEQLNIDLRLDTVNTAGPFINANYISGDQAYDLSISSLSGELLLGAKLSGQAQLQGLTIGAADNASFSGVFTLSAGSLLSQFDNTLGNTADLFALQFNLTGPLSPALFINGFNASISGDIQFSQAVPEPSSTGLMLAALAALIMIRRQNKRSANHVISH